MNNPFDFFDKIYCIHLPYQTERLETAIKEYKKFGIDERVTFIHTIPPDDNFKISNMSRAPKGEFGCNMSHIKAVVHAIAYGAQHPWFMEDDLIFSPNTVEKLSRALEELPSDWDILYLGGHPRGPVTQHSNNLVKVSNFSFADSYVINKPTLIKFFDMWADKISKPLAPYDFILGNFAANMNSYCVYPIVCEQRPGVSGITRQEENKKELIVSRWQKWLTKKH